MGSKPSTSTNQPRPPAPSSPPQTRPTAAKSLSRLSMASMMSERKTPSPSPESGRKSHLRGSQWIERSKTFMPFVSDSSLPPHKAWKNADIERLLREDPNAAWWERADKIATRQKITVQPDNKRCGWKTVRIFVSSTFKDMHSEREYLVKRIFPRLRQWCDERKLRLVECDLRWGVPKDADTRQTLTTCLSEIDRCYEENEYPYLLVLLSERYGWIPSIDEIPSDVLHRYKWIPSMSVTTMELMTGGYWAKNPNAIYMLRQPDYLEKLDSDMKKVYEETDDKPRTSLKVLKDKLQNLAPDEGTVCTYTCQVDSVDKKRAYFTGLDAFGDTVLNHFKMAMERQYPIQGLNENPSLTDVQWFQHEDFMLQRSALLLGRDDVLKTIDQYIDSQDSKPTPLVMVGYPGAGKSAIMATVARRLQDKEDSYVFYHFVGATPGSTDLFALLTRIWTEFMSPEDKPPTDSNELRRSLPFILEHTAKRGKLVLLIDALNQLDSSGGDQLEWLPRSLPTNVRIIVSTLDGEYLDALRQPGLAKLPELLITALGKDVRKDIVSKILSEYNKKLDAEQLKILVNKEDAGRPLYLAFACEELRVFGDFRKLTEKIEKLSPDLTNLLVQVLDRIVAENGGELVVATLCLIESSKFGLLENELLDMLASYSKLADSSEEPLTRLPMAEWALVYIGLRPFLRPTGGSGEGRIDFYHRTISKSVRAKYLADGAARRRWHQRLAEYFTAISDMDRRAEELPYQLMKSDNVERLKQVLVEKAMFDRLYTPSTKPVLLSYWVYAGGYEIAAKLQLEGLEKYLKAHKDNLSQQDTLAARTDLVNFLTDIGQYSHAEDQLTKLISETSSAFGNESKELCGPLFAAVVLFYLQGIKVVYSNDPVYVRCSKMGRDYATKCVKVHKKHYQPNDLHLGRVLTKCGYFMRDVLDEAKLICKGRSPQDYAEVLYMLGEKNQYQTITIPENLYEESLKLCLSHFGHYHLNTARCYQLYGQLYWNQYVSYEKKADWMNKCLLLYQQELDILENLLGAKHPTTVRSRDDVIIILQTLGRNAEAAKLQAQQ